MALAEKLILDFSRRHFRHKESRWKMDMYCTIDCSITPRISLRPLPICPLYHATLGPSHCITPPCLSSSRQQRPGDEVARAEVDGGAPISAAAQPQHHPVALGDDDPLRLITAVPLLLGIVFNLQEIKEQLKYTAACRSKASATQCSV